jgi:hypothetical protein
VLLVVLGLSLAGCGAPSEQAKDMVDGQTHGHVKSTPTSSSSLPSEVLTVAQFGVELGCDPVPMVQAADFHQAKCATDDADLVLLDFQSNDGQRAWLDYALAYGGTYLVGERWVMSTDSRDYLEKMQTRFGGTIAGS